MKRQTKFGLSFAGVFLAIAFSLIAWYWVVPADQLIVLFVLFVPGSLILPVIFPPDTPVVVQEWLAIGVGSLQYFLVGFAIGRISKKNTASNKQLP